MIERNAYKTLLQWKNADNRKPILLRGARQVGKTTLIRQFSKEFDNFVELNLERSSDLNIFSTDDINKLINAAFLVKQVEPKNGTTLLFIDEIQESPKAIQLLRYFYEDRPDIYVVAAGSLLEFALKKVPNFPVGRISYLYMHPLNFKEFIGAKNHTAALTALNTVPLPPYAIDTLKEIFHEYCIIGGMPEVVSQYVSSGNIAGLSKIYKQLWQSYKDDVEKYASNNTERKIIQHIIDAAPYEPDRIKFEGFANSNYRSREVGEAFRTLDLAGIIKLVYPCTETKPPLVENTKKRPRLQILDTGLLNHTLQNQAELILINDMNDFYRGKIIQHLVSQEIATIDDSSKANIHFWVREEKGKSSEVDLLYHYGKYLIPIEIKSGPQGRLRSLHEFIDRTNHFYAIRFYAGEFKIEAAQTIKGKRYLLMNLPYFLGTKLIEYIEFFISKYPIIEN